LGVKKVAKGLIELTLRLFAFLDVALYIHYFLGRGCRGSGRIAVEGREAFHGVEVSRHKEC
jgi:hypothetical protein